MKLNLDYYQTDLIYNQYENEETIISDYIKNRNDEQYDDIFDEDKTIDTILALSDIRKNIISWYPFKANCTILEIGAGLGEITGELCNKAEHVVSIEFSKKRGEAIAKRHEEKQNLEVMIGKLQDICLEEKFDYITLIGILEYAEELNMTQEEILQYAKARLKENGIILLADNNRLGMQYWTRLTEKNECIEQPPKGKKLLTLKEMGQLLKKCDLSNNKIYYVQPDIALTNVIFTDECLPDEENITRNIVYGSEENIEFYSQNQMYKQILKEKKELFPIFANAFFVEIFINQSRNNGIKMVSFSNIRKPEYRIKTIITEKEVYKYKENCKAIRHIEEIKRNIDIMRKSGLHTLDSYDEEKIISQFSKEKTLDKVIVELVKQGKKEEMFSLIQTFKEELLSKLEGGTSKNNVFDKYEIDYKASDIENLHFIQHGLWDLIFQNCFYYNQEFYFYDQEWREENLPVEFILYRAILYFGKLKQYISDEEIYETLGILKDQVALFKQLDDKIQYQIRKEAMWKIHNQQQNVMQIKEKMLTIQHERNLLAIDNQKKTNEINSLKQTNEQLKTQLESTVSSKSWKITEPIRKLISKKEKEQKNEIKR